MVNNMAASGSPGDDDTFAWTPPPVFEFGVEPEGPEPPDPNKPEQRTLIIVSCVSILILFVVWLFYKTKNPERARALAIRARRAFARVRTGLQEARSKQHSRVRVVPYMSSASTEGDRPAL